MIDKEYQLLFELRITLSKMELSLDAIDDCIVWVDGKGTIQWSNEKFSKLVNRRTIEILDKLIQNVLFLKYKSNPINWDELLSKTSSENKTIYQLINDNRDIKFFEVSARTFHQIGKEINIIIVLYDVTETYLIQKKLEDANSDLKYANAELAKNALMKSKLAAIVEFTDDAIISRTLEGNVESWNRGAELLYGYKAEEVLGKSVGIIYPLHKQVEFYYSIEQIKKGKTFQLSETERLHKDGHMIPVSVKISPIRNARGDVIGSCSIARDITELKEMMNLKNEFISTVSHELRTPLTSIQGSLDLLIAGTVGELPEDARKLLIIGKSNAERLVRLINDMLDIQKIEAGKMKFHLEPIDIATLVQESILANQGYADQFNIKIKFIQKSTAIVNVDRDRILQVLTNLISNAVKFSSADEITICLFKKDNNVRIEVSNKGAGIPKKFQSRIFQKFSQAKSEGRERRGTGLGLSISKEIIEKHNGHIGFESVENKKTTFFFELPIYKDSNVN